MNDYLDELNSPDRDELRDDIREYVSDQDLRDYFGDRFDKKILTYSDLSKYSTIDKLLPRKIDSCIILIEHQPNKGHWVAMLKYPKVIEFFNSYGDRPSAGLDFNSEHTNEVLDQSKDTITDLLDKATRKYTVIYNKKKFQKLGSGINTCGKHCIFRSMCLKKYGLTLAQYIKFFDDLKKHYKLSNDELISLLVPIEDDQTI